MRSWLTIWTMIFGLAALGCGGGEEAANPGETSSGDEDPWGEVDLGGDHENIAVDDMDESHPPLQADTEATATGPARITVVNQVSGEDVGGNVSVLNADGEVVESGRSGSTFTLPAGRYRLAGEITSDDDVLGKPSKEMEDMVDITPGQEATLPVVFSVANVKVRVERGGRVIRTWRLELTRRGSEAPIQLSSSDGFQHIRAGRYDGTLTFGATRIEVSDIIFQGGARGEVPIRVD